MRISDWSSDVCSSDLDRGQPVLDRFGKGWAIRDVEAQLHRTVGRVDMLAARARRADESLGNLIAVDGNGSGDLDGGHGRDVAQSGPMQKKRKNDPAARGRGGAAGPSNVRHGTPQQIYAATCP